LGFEARDRLLVSVNLGLQGYSGASGRRFYDDVLLKMNARPDVAAEGARLGVWGLTAGLAGAIVVGHAMASLRFGVPARRAARLDPMRVLRTE
jgi:hypothetical protein